MCHVTAHDKVVKAACQASAIVRQFGISCAVGMSAIPRSEDRKD